MSQELLYLFGSVLILLILIIAQAGNTVVSKGVAWGVGPRDDSPNDNLFAGRVKRTIANHVEGLVLFGFAILIVESGGLQNDLTTLGSALYFWARLAYAPTYLLGIPWIRTLVWTVGLIGTLIVLYVCGTAAL